MLLDHAVVPRWSSAVSEGGDAERVLKPSVGRGGGGQPHRRELLDIAEPLDHGGVEQVSGTRRKGDVVADAVPHGETETRSAAEFESPSRQAYDPRLTGNRNLSATGSTARNQRLPESDWAVPFSAVNDTPCPPPFEPAVPLPE